jgi:glycine/D-amino acid oxidase-like deaminating enzyme
MSEVAPGALARDSLAAAEPTVLWLTDADRPTPSPGLCGAEDADLVVVGGGYTGLWTALRAKERYPGFDVVLLEAGACGDQASGRNGGFASASLTHGFGNGQARWPEELAELDRLGADNLTAIGETVTRYGIDCGWERTGELMVATAPHQVEELAGLAQDLNAAGHGVELLDESQVRAQVASPSYLSGVWDRNGTVMVEPARLAWGLREACLSLGVRIYEQTPVTGLDRAGPAMLVRTPAGRVRAARVALATNAFPPLLRRLRLMTVPVYDYVLATEPLTRQQLASVGWRNRQGIGDAANLFHYYRLTRDNRILWGGYDAVYHYGRRIDARYDQRPATFAALSEHFFETFPQLEGLRFTHRWGGAIDTSTRFCAFFGTAHGGAVAYAAGYTGLGVGASRFGADVMLDRLSGEPSDRTRLDMVRRRPLPFPPEPLAYAGIQLTRRSLRKADRDEGRRDLWLRTLDRLGLGFDS